jgi:hypothetical protein
MKDGRVSAAAEVLTVFLQQNYCQFLLQLKHSVSVAAEVSSCQFVLHLKYCQFLV